MIQTILAGRKTATSCPDYDPENADLKADDELQLLDKHGTVRGQMIVTRVEVRAFGPFDEALAAKEGVSLPELKEKLKFAHVRPIREDEEMRGGHFRLRTAS